MLIVSGNGHGGEPDGRQDGDGSERADDEHVRERLIGVLLRNGAIGTGGHLGFSYVDSGNLWCLYSDSVDDVNICFHCLH